MRRLGRMVAAIVVAISIGHSAFASGVSIVDFGADPTGTVDSTVAIKSAVRLAKLRGQTVLVPAGTFRHRHFDLPGVKMEGVGSSSVLLAPDPHDSNIELLGSGPSIRNLAVVVKSSMRDWKIPNVAIYINQAERFVIESVSVTGGDAGGIFNYGGRDGRILHNSIQDTLADGIYNTHGARNLVIAENTVRRAGDDMISVVSYEGEPVAHDILISGNDVADQTHGRGISVVGGANVTISDNTVARTYNRAGIYIASESAWKTAGVTHVRVEGNTLYENGSAFGQGAIMMFADAGTVQDIIVRGNKITNARGAAIKILGKVINVALIDNYFFGPSHGSIISNGTQVVCSGNTLSGATVVTPACRQVEDLETRR